MGKIVDVITKDEFRNMQIEEWAEGRGIDEDEMITLIKGLKDRAIEDGAHALIIAEVLGIAFHLGVEVGMILNPPVINVPWAKNQ